MRALCPHLHSANMSTKGKLLLRYKWKSIFKQSMLHFYCPVIFFPSCSCYHVCLHYFPIWWQMRLCFSDLAKYYVFPRWFSLSLQLACLIWLASKTTCWDESRRRVCQKWSGALRMHHNSSPKHLQLQVWARHVSVWWGTVQVVLVRLGCLNKEPR